MLSDSINIIGMYWTGTMFKRGFIMEFDVVSGFTRTAKVEVMECKDFREIKELIGDALFPFWWKVGLTKVEI